MNARIKNKRFAAGLTALIVSMFVILASAYIAAETGHDCEGEHCPVCECIQRFRASMEGCDSGIPGPATLFFGIVLIVGMPDPLPVTGISTPVSCKVRLND